MLCPFIHALAIVPIILESLNVGEIYKHPAIFLLIFVTMYKDFQLRKIFL